ncbi:helix-turn-helix domain-containing protein [Dehalogenimonas formicexedens]|uniref:helix-turn-helix domain-containing protein n=1 Tax=Dehalogenimonas formicexedens TaxID=1839801 RepID=UPI001CEF6C12
MARKKITANEENVESPFYTFTEAQQFLKVSHQTIYRLMQKGLPSHKVGNKRVFIKADLIKWVQEH